MAELLESQSNSKTASKPHQTSSEDCFLSNESDWVELSSRRTNNIVYSSGYNRNGMATIGVKEYEEDKWIVLYNIINEGGSEPISNILGDQKPGLKSYDLPYNNFEKKENAVEYAETLMQVDLEGLFCEYGLKADPLR